MSPARLALLELPSDQAPALRRALADLGCGWGEAAAPDPEAFDGLLIPGGMGLQSLLDEGEGRVLPGFAGRVRAFHARGRWIGAPCVAQAFVLSALSPSPEALACAEADGLAVFADLRLLTTVRPWLGRGREALEPAASGFVRRLAELAGAGASHP